jgi:hypothetical protein
MGRHRELTIERLAGTGRPERSDQQRVGVHAVNALTYNALRQHGIIDKVQYGNIL